MIFTATLTEKQAIAPEIFLFRFAVDGELRYRPGQFVMIEIGDIRRRPYSIASHAKTGEGNLDLLVDTSPHGQASEYFERLKIGETTEMQGPFGLMASDAAAASHLLIAAGVGIAPMLPMIEQLLHSGYLGQMRLVYGARNPQRMAFQNELDGLASTYPNFSFIKMFSESEGRVTDWLSANYRPSADEQVTVCGRPEMVRDCHTLLLAAGANQKNIQIEVFS